MKRSCISHFDQKHLQCIFMHILHLSLPHVIYSLLTDTQIIFVCSRQSLSSMRRGISAMYLSTDSNSRGVLISWIIFHCWYFCVPAQHGVSRASTLSWTYSSSNGVAFEFLVSRWIICHLIDLSLTFITVPYCETLLDSDGCPYHLWPHLPYH